MKKFNVINVVIIGCGKIAEKHALILTSKVFKKFQLVGVCDTNKKKAISFGKKFKIKNFNNIDTLLESTKANLAVICTSSGNHYLNALTVSKYKIDLVIEKPISLNLLDANKIVRIFNNDNKKLFVVMQNRLNPLIKYLKEAILKNILGKITSISIKVWWSRDQKYYDEAAWRGTWEADGGIFMNQAIHHLDMMTWLMGPVKSVSAVIKRRLVKIETEDTGSAILEFKNGVIGTIEASTAIRPKNLENSITVMGDKGNIKIGGLYMNNLEINETKNKKVANLLLKKFLKIKNKNNHYLFYEHVLENLLNKKKKEKHIDGKEAIKSLEIVTAIYQSVIKKKRIYLPLKTKIKNKKSNLLSELKN